MIPRLSHHPLGNEAQERIVTDNDVIEDLDSHQIPRLSETAGDLDVLAGRGRGAGGMIVDEKDVGRRLAYRLGEDLAGMNDALVEGAFGNLDLANDPVLAVEE